MEYNMLRTFMWYFLGWAGLILSYPMLLRLKYYELRGRTDLKDRLANRGSQRIARYLFRLTGSTVTITGLENIPDQGAVLFVSNHQGHMDSLIIHGYIPKPKGFISIVEVLKYPIIRTWMKQIHCVFIDRNNARQSSGCINQAIEYLKQGHSMVVFPEGHLNDGAETACFQRGWLRLATKSGAPIVPVSISGSYKALAKDGSRVASAQVDCVISKPIHPEKLKKADEVEFIDKLRTEIQSHIRSQAV